MTDDDLKHLPLEDLHVAAGARFGGFAGWHMPLTYPAGVMKEHQHTRSEAGLFDISHMKLIEVHGADASRLLETACPMDPATLEAGRSKLSLMLDEAAGILDDLIVTRLGPERFMVVVNAGNADADAAHLAQLAAALNVTVTPLDRVFLALQGPASEAVLVAAGVEGLPRVFMSGTEPHPGWFVTRSGYTGEDGFEIGLPEADARKLLGSLLADSRVMWIGLAARDSLRLEAGLCLHGSDISADTDPASAALMWTIPKPVREAGRFIGAKALAAIVARGAPEKRVGLKPDGRQPVRGGTPLTDEDGQPAGRVTSGGFGPSAGHPVAMGYVPAALARAGTRLYADVRGNRIAVDVHSLPFTPHRTVRG